MARGRERDPFQGGAQQFRLAVRRAEAKILGSRVAVMPEALSREIGHEEERVGTGPGFGSLGDHMVVAHRIAVERASRPAHRVAARLQQDERPPVSLDRLDVADLGVEQRLFRDQGQDAGGSGHV